MRKWIGALLFACIVRCVNCQNENISNGNDFDGEPCLAVNPYDPMHIVVAWMSFDGLDLVEICTRVSFDGGNSWNAITQIPHEITGNTSADPSLAFDSNGDVFVCYIDYNPIGTSGAVYIRKSADGGLNWAEAVEAINAADDITKAPVDRPWMAIDRSEGIYDGAIFITTKPAPWIPIPNRNYLVVSTDGGNTFSDWKFIDRDGWSIGPFIQAPMATPCVSSSGEFHCVYPAFDPTENILPRFVHASSSDGGETLDYDEMIESFGDDLMTDTLPKLGYLLISDPMNPDHLVFSFIVRPDGDADIFIIESLDDGNSWSDKIRVNDDPIGNGVMQDMVWADFSDEGDLLLTWRDRRNAPDTGFAVSSEFWAAVRWKDSISFSPNFRLSDELVAFNDVLSENGNDFMGCSLSEDTVYATWGEVRDTWLNIWFAKVSAKTGTGTAIQNLNTYQSTAVFYPDPATDFLILLNPEYNALRIYNTEGEMLYSDDDIISTQIDISFLPVGIYLVSAKTDNETFTQTLMKK